MFVAVEIVAMISLTPFWRDNTKAEISELSAALQVSKTSDLVMDAEGETIYRVRPWYYAVEAFTRARIERGLITDDIAENLVATKTAIVRPRGLTRQARDFVRENYISLGTDLCVLGKVFDLAQRPQSAGHIEFSIPISGRYVMVDKQGRKTLEGEMDGVPFDTSKELSAGNHVFVPRERVGNHVALFWAEAFERGFFPFR
jgi:hypothetical protein